MRKRGVKKMVQNAKKNMRPIRQMRTGGSKSARRRLKAYNRVGRAFRREDKRKLAERRQLLIDIDTYEPQTDAEREGLPGLREHVLETIRMAEAKAARYVAVQKQHAEMSRILRKLQTHKPTSWEDAVAPLNELTKAFGGFKIRVKDPE